MIGRTAAPAFPWLVEIIGDQTESEETEPVEGEETETPEMEPPTADGPYIRPILPPGSDFPPGTEPDIKDIIKAERIAVWDAGLGQYLEIGFSNIRTGVLQETFAENAAETGRARVKLHVADYENSSEENGLKTKLGEEEVTAYCSKAKDGDTIESGTRVDLWFVNNRWDIVNANCEPG